MPPKRATIYEVAGRAGVSHQTVSRYLQNNGGLKPATVARVQAAIDELNYRPNRIARSMRTRRTGRIAILLPTAPPSCCPLRLLGAASATAHEAGYTRRPGRLRGRSRRPGRRGPRSWPTPVSSRASSALASLGAAADRRVRDPGRRRRRLRRRAARARRAGRRRRRAARSCRHLSGLGHRSFLHLAGPAGLRLRPEPTPDLPRHGTPTRPAGPGDRLRLVGPQSGYEAVMSLPPDTDDHRSRGRQRHAGDGRRPRRA